MASRAESRQFELLVARIEEAASPRGATVRSPDRIRDSTSEQMREVDATIRFTVGTTPILILIECRKRGRTEDVRWIEELATKRDSLRADKVIAVSAAAFSAPAVRAAKHHRIEVRTLAEVSAADIGDWFLPHGGVINVLRIIDDVECIVGFEALGTSSGDRGFSVPGTAPVFTSDLIPSPFPAEVFVQLMEQAEPERFWKVPLDGPKTRLVVNMNCENSGFTATTSAGTRKVFWVSLAFLVSYEAKRFALQEGVHHVYRAMDRPDVQLSSFDGELLGAQAKFEFQSGDAARIMARLELIPPKKEV
mgnify:CR=1 FL=1